MHEMIGQMFHWCPFFESCTWSEDTKILVYSFFFINSFTNTLICYLLLVFKRKIHTLSFNVFRNFNSHQSRWMGNIREFRSSTPDECNSYSCIVSFYFPKNYGCLLFIPYQVSSEVSLILQMRKLRSERINNLPRSLS